MWDIRESKKVQEFCLLQKRIKSVACDPHNKDRFAAGYQDGTVHIWDIKSNSGSIRD